ncbi:hypothetical protein [Metabacillus iocasae]|uniref:Uncharacterized protein n=1 Tax=Priestia iocasae TaxID=2291674 RepID=A0ABS2QSE3_9BACI|nr:hypothetical protein [Metabacillus iocasae]MBM7702344.1 hypothetical protein [Metabacillus iocasae]
MFDFLNGSNSLQVDTTDQQQNVSGGQLDTNNQMPVSVHSFDHPLMSRGNEHICQHYDPLLHANKFQMERLDLHHVKPHFVEGYVKSDGTVVDGYFRDGNGHGYVRSNPDGILENNLNYEGEK